MPSINSWAKLPTNGRARSILALALLCLLVSNERAVAAPAAVPFSRERILIIPKAGREAALENQHAGEKVKIKRKFPGLGNIHVIELPPGADPEAVVERYRRNGHVEAADLDFQRWQPAAVPNDPYFVGDLLWHLNNTGATGGTPDADIDAPEAWDILNSASNIIVAIIDSGARLTHEDLAANLWTNPGETGLDQFGNDKATNGIDDDGNGYIDDVHGVNVLTGSGNPMDDFSHGTPVTGMIGAVGNNGLGVCGVAWKTQLMPVKFFYPGNPSDSDLMVALDYARAKGAKIINFSYTAPTSTSVLSNAFLAMQNADIVVVTAAGNNRLDNNVTPKYPASYKMSNLVAVAATDRSDNLYYWSNYGSTSVHLAAPGVGIYSTVYGADNAYDSGDGTSFAAPLVSGAAALLRAKYTNESSAQIIRRILNGVDVLPGLAGRCITSGRLNLRRALDPASLPQFSKTNAVYAWVPTNGLTRTNMPFSTSVSGPLPLPFTFPFYGRGYTQIWVSANGTLGITDNALGSDSPTSIPATNLPNAIYPYWDSLNVPGGGGVWWGIAGVAPNRKFVASWVGVAHMAGGAGPVTFQAVLHESGQVAFQYQQVESGSTAFSKGRHATIGIEEPSGLFGTRHRNSGETNTQTYVTNNQALVFTPQPLTHPAPGLRLTSGPAPGQIQLTLSGEPAQPAAILFSTNPTAGWSMVYSNILPASGLASFTETNASPQKFYRALSGPFSP